MLVQVVIESAGRTERRVINAPDGHVTIGRAHNCTLPLDSVMVSRTHVSVDLNGPAMLVTDLSTNGTLAGDRFVRGSTAEVAYGVPIVVGDCTVWLRNGGERAVAPVSEAPAPIAQKPTVPPPVHAPVPGANGASHADAPAAAPPSQGPDGRAVEQAQERARRENVALRREIHRLVLEHLDLATVEPSKTRRPVASPEGAERAAAHRQVDRRPDPGGGQPRRPRRRARRRGARSRSARAVPGGSERQRDHGRGSEHDLHRAERASSSRPTRASPTTSAFAPSSSASSPRSAAASTSRRRSSTRASTTARASTPSSVRSRSAARPSRSASSHGTPLDARQAHRLRRDHAADGAASSRASVVAKKNIVIAGGTGSGKTTLLNVLSGRHPVGRAHRHDRRRRRAPAPPAARRLARDAPGEHGGQGRVHHPRSREERAAHAPGPHRRRRVPRRRGARHAPGDEHGPRRLAHDDARQQRPRGHRAPRDAGAHGGHRPSGARHPRADRRQHPPPRAAVAPLRRQPQGHRRSPRSPGSTTTARSSSSRSSSSPERGRGRRARSSASSAPPAFCRSFLNDFIVMGLVKPGEAYL